LAGLLGRLFVACCLSFAVASCQSTSDAGSPDITSAPGQQSTPGQTGDTAQPRNVAAAAQTDQIAQQRYFIEFRSRYALSYGHSFVIFGRLDAAGNMIDPEVAGLHPASDSSVPYMVGHVLPVPAETGWSDGDLEDEYMSANWRVMLSEAEYRKVVAYIRKLQASSPVWHAALYNCNAFVADIAASMGYRTPFIWLRPQQFITKLREMNGGPNAIGSTSPYAG